MTKVDVPVPKTVILPSYEMPTDTKGESFGNLAYPLDWEGIFNYVGFPAYMKPYAGGGWKNVYKLHDINEFYEKHAETNQLVMLLQKKLYLKSTTVVIALAESMCVLCLTNPATRITCVTSRIFHPRLSGINQWKTSCYESTNIWATISIQWNWLYAAMSYAIDFGNPAPDAERAGVGEENFEWVVGNRRKLRY
jgi:hypothetical protein